MIDFIDVCQTGNDHAHTPRQLMMKVGIRLFLCYLLAVFFCWEEVRFWAAVDVPAVLTVVSHQDNGKSTVRYRFSDPETGQLHQNTVQIRTVQIPAEKQVTAQYLASTYSSRLTLQSRPWIVNTFLGVNLALLSAIGAGIGYLAWESNQTMPTRQQRAMAEYHKRKQNEKFQRMTAT